MVCCIKFLTNLNKGKKINNKLTNKLVLCLLFFCFVYGLLYYLNVYKSIGW